jgi:hypothetical protein
VCSWSTDHRIVHALAVLPPVLVHGDVHAGNVLISPDSAVLIDWGQRSYRPRDARRRQLRTPRISQPPRLPEGVGRDHRHAPETDDSRHRLYLASVHVNVR